MTRLAPWKSPRLGGVVKRSAPSTPRRKELSAIETYLKRLSDPAIMQDNNYIVDVLHSLWKDVNEELVSSSHAGFSNPAVGPFKSSIRHFFTVSVISERLHICLLRISVLLRKDSSDYRNSIFHGIFRTDNVKFTEDVCKFLMSYLRGLFETILLIV